ncbi:MAG: CDP-alcohol phosphatidyltransferase family protein [Deltaproteobacteria bacterium]|nr:CDP-alcohol phosphatidyltransferase family protein [Deltaproteobacteria bacterium]
MLALHPFWIAFGPVLVINFLFLSSIIYFSLTGKAEKREVHEAARRTRSKFLNYFFKEWWIWATDPIARFLAKAGVGPNLITFAGFVMSVIAAFLFAAGQFGYAGWTMVLGATFDTFDGRVARLTGKVSRSGAFFDSVMDRFGEGVCFIGLGWYFHASFILPFVIAALIGSMMVSYTRACGQVAGIDCKVGSMQRPERIVYMGVSGILQPVVTLLLLPLWKTPSPILVMGALLLIAVWANATAIYRMIYIMNAIDTTDRKKDEPSIPQILTRLSTHEGREEFFKRNIQM